MTCLVCGLIGAVVVAVPVVIFGGQVVAYLLGIATVAVPVILYVGIVCAYGQ